MATKKAKKDVDETVHIERLQRTSFKVFLIGETPLIVHAWSQKGKLQMLKTHMQQISVREAKDPEDHFLRSIYRMEDGAYGFPVVGIKEAMATATVDLENITKAEVYRNIFVTGRRGYEIAAFADLKTSKELAELFSPNPPAIREDIVRLSGPQRTPDLRYRAEFWPWCLRLNVAYIDNFTPLESILNLLHHSGVRVGLGEHRQEKGGNNGMFHVAEAHELSQCEKWAAAKQKEPEKIDTTAWLKTLTSEPKQQRFAGGQMLVASSKPRATKSNGEAAQ